MESAEVAWTCACGIKVKAGLDMTRPNVTVQCPNSSCDAKHILPGQITRLSVETELGVWRSVDVNSLIYPPEKSA
jgi:hypothetical protein